MKSTRGSQPKPIRVTSHVARDFLQNAAYFNTMPKLIWEYVSNSLDATKEGVLALVAVEISNHEITVADNGRGMSREELNSFFQMHGENIQRKQGKAVRGRFGTGKSAAFGLANYLRIDTRRSGFLNAVELHRKDIEQAKTGEPFVVRDLIVDELTEEEAGTIITIRELQITRPDIDKVLGYVERHLSRYRTRARVTINGHECKFEEIPFVQEAKVSAPSDVKEVLGDVELVIRVSPTPLEEELNGIDILSRGIWHGTTLARLERKERANYLFGEIDVPILEEQEWAIPPFDNTRNNTLNEQNPAVAVLLGWLSEEIEKVRTALVEQDRDRKKTDEAKKLAQEAQKIADILNEDFAQVELDFEIARQASNLAGKKSVNEASSLAGKPTPGGGDLSTGLQQTGNPHGHGQRGNRASSGDTPRPGPDIRPGSESGGSKDFQDGYGKKRRAIFSLEYVNETPSKDRSRYDPKTKTIYINLDHPQIASAFKLGGNQIDHPNFRQICYEVAAVEYAIAIPHEKKETEELYDASDALYDVRLIVNRVTRRLTESLAR